MTFIYHPKKFWDVSPSQKSKVGAASLEPRHAEARRRALFECGGTGTLAELSARELGKREALFAMAESGAPRCKWGTRDKKVCLLGLERPRNLGSR